MKEYKQSSTTHPFTFLLVSSTDHVTPVTGASPTVTISKDGASFASPAGAVSEIGNGWYALAGNATDRNTLGSLLEVTAGGYLKEGKRFATVGIGCTGGKHRSVAIAEEFGRRLREAGHPVKVLHRDVGRE